jgi:hypothetical protein
MYEILDLTTWRILRRAATAWDHYHQAKDYRELASRLNGSDLPPEVVNALVGAKKAQIPEHPSVTAMHQLSAIHPATLARAEKHPAVLQALVKAIQQR